MYRTGQRYTHYYPFPQKDWIYVTSITYGYEIALATKKMMEKQGYKNLYIDNLTKYY